jgi:hypothetical protein
VKKVLPRINADGRGSFGAWDEDASNKIQELGWSCHFDIGS